jgi:Protein of unknown function (DUF2568)
MKTANDVLAFLLEIAAIMALAHGGLSVGSTLVTRLGLGLGAPMLLVACWAVWLAPRLSRTLGMPWLVLAKLAILEFSAGSRCSASFSGLSLPSTSDLLLAGVGRDLSSPDRRDHADCEITQTASCARWEPGEHGCVARIAAEPP